MLQYEKKCKKFVNISGTWVVIVQEYFDQSFGWISRWMVPCDSFEHKLNWSK